MCLVPGSLDYRSDNRNTKTWSCNSIHFENRVKISHLEKELSKIKYEFECSIPDKISTSLLRKIIEVDRISRFAVGGITKHVINFIVKSRKKNRISKMKNNLEIIGVAQQRTVKS